MPKPKIPNQRKAQLEHKKRIERYVALINHLYDKLNKEASKLALATDHDPAKQFLWSDYPQTKAALEKLQSQYISEIQAIIMAGTSAEWKESNLVQDLVANKVLKAYTGSTKSGEEYTRYFETNPASLQAFQQRRAAGMNLSTRVWNLSEQYKTELEMAVSAAIEPGTSAMELAADIKKYLNEPDMMFRRFRYKDENGEWKRKWKQKVMGSDGKVHFIDADPTEYHPGRGLYRSSARNAQRLARTEINMSYRTAEQERWRQFDFVVGYEVKTTQNGHHVEDICDALAGKYPKTFKFMGWHPQCMCYSIPILKTEDEFFDDDTDAKSANEVEDVPQGFKDWIKDNEERIERAEKRGTLPYFIRDNRGEMDRILNPDKKAYREAENSPHYGAAMKLGRSATKEAMKIVENIGAPELTEVQKKNILELADALGVPRKEIKPMSFLDADQGASNPTKSDSNCQSVVVAFSARRRGLNCSALPYDETNTTQNYLMSRFNEAWLVTDRKGQQKFAPITTLRGKSDEEAISKLKKQLTADGEYVLGINYKMKPGEEEPLGHVLSIIRENGEVIIHDEQQVAQRERFINIESFEDIDYFELIRIDKATLNVGLIKQILHI